MLERDPASRLADLAQYPEGALIPLRRWDDVVVKDGVERSVGKAPRDPLWRRRTYTRDDIRAAVEQGWNVGFRMGETDAVIDYDPRNDPTGEGRAALAASLPAGFLDTCPHVRTGSGGDHWYIRLAEPMALRANVDGMPGVELKGHGRQVVAPGSKHPNGAWYEWDDPCPPLGEAPLLPTDSGLAAASRRPGAGDRSEMAGGEMSGDQLARLLAQLDPAAFREHDAWLSVAMASYHATGGTGLDEFVAWSTSDEEYAGHEQTIRDRWPTFNRTDGPVATIRTLFKYVEDAGGSLAGLYADAFPDDQGGGDDDDPFAPAPPEPPAPEGVEGWGDDPIVDGPNRPLYEMNRRYCVVWEGGKHVIYERMGNAGGSGEAPYRRHMADGLKLKMRNSFLEREAANGQGRQVPLLDAWLEWPRRRYADSLVFDPSGKTDLRRQLNTWDGWAVVPDASKPWPLIRELVESVLAPGASEYVFGWCAHMLQRPEQPAEVALVFRGKRGTGKGTFLTGVLKAIAGRHGRQISSGLTRQFNAYLRDTVYLFADEAFWAGDKGSEGKLKALVTEPKIFVEPKGLEPYEVDNRLHIAIASNEDWVVPAGADERRFAVLEVSASRRGDTAFWNALRAEMANGGVAGFMAAMLARDLGEWHPRLDVPQSEGLIAQKLETLDPFELWWFDTLRDGTMAFAEVNEDGTPADWATGSVIVRAADIRASIKHHSRVMPRGVSTRLGRRLRELIPSIERMRDGAGEREWMYRIPSRPECRAAFEAWIGGNPGWDL